MKKLINKLRIKLSIYFAILITLTIVAISVLFSVYFYSNVNNLFGKYQSGLEKVSNSLFLTVSQSFKYGIDKNDFGSSKELVNFLKNENIVSYVFLKKEEAKNANYEINDEDENKKENYKIVYGDPEEYETLFGDNVDKRDIMEKNNVKPYTLNLSSEYRLIVGVPIEKVNFNIYDGFAKMIIKLLLGIFIISIVISYLMANSVTRPIKNVSDAAKQIMDGNFDVKIEESHFEEINNLAYSYNEMTTQLNELYSSLELKVQERTIALEEANYKLKETQAMMVHSEKMRSLGELVAGIAHEINNPVNFIHGNIMILQNYADDLLSIIDLYSEIDNTLPEDFRIRAQKLKKDVDLEFLRGDIKDLIKSCIEGTQRTKNIVLDLKNFSRMEEMVLTQFDIPKEIDTTLNILNNKYKNRITIVKNYSPDVPKIEAYGGQLNQVFMNILDNAQDAIEGEGTLTINLSKVDDNEVKIEFIDTGKGIPPENLKKVFDPFFTTKPVGKGTGLGMSISYRVIHDHKGTIEVDSEVGKGTKFTITLPINHKEKSENVDDGAIV